MKAFLVHMILFGMMQQSETIIARRRARSGPSTAPTNMVIVLGSHSPLILANPGNPLIFQ